MENDLFNLHPHKEYHISQIELKPSIDGEKFVVYGKLYPKHTYGLFHFQRPDNKAQALVPLTSPPDFGFGAEELIYSDVSDIINNPNSPIKQVL